MEDDLTWLARNVHEWPTINNGKAHIGGDKSVIYAHGCQDGCGYTKHQWQTRRAELGLYAAEWTGHDDGLPPLGTICEALIPHDPNPLWVEIEVISHWQSESGSVYSWVAEKDGFYPPAILQFRPLRTEEDKAVEAMLELDPYAPDKKLGMMSRSDFCRTIYRAIKSGELVIE